MRSFLRLKISRDFFVDWRYRSEIITREIFSDIFIRLIKDSILIATTAHGFMKIHTFMNAIKWN